MSKFRGKLSRIAEEFDKDLLEITRDRLKIGKDNKPQSSRRITLGVHRHPLFSVIKNDLKNADLPEDRLNVKSKRGFK